MDELVDSVTVYYTLNLQIHFSHFSESVPQLLRKVLYHCE